MNELETGIVDVSDSALEELFNETPDKTVNANNLVGGKKEAQEEPDLENEEEEIEEQPAKKKGGSKNKTKQPVFESNSIEDIDLDTVEEVEDDDDEDEEEDEEEKKPKKAPKKAPEKEEAKKEEVEQTQEVHSILKHTADFLIESGIWEDFEGREDLEMTQENYAKLVAEQDKRRVENMFSELVDSTGPFGKAIIEYTKNGGNPDEIIDLFKEQKSVESINIEETDGQKDIIKHYYSEVLGWKPEKIEKYMSNLMLSNELENEATEVKELFQQFYKKEAERLNSEREEFTKKQKEAEEAFEGNIKTSIRDRKDLTTSEKRQVEEYLLSYDQRLPNGNLVNKFYVNFAKMQANPSDYIDLVLFVMDKQKFVEKVAIKEKSQAASKAFNFIKGNGAVSTKKGTSYDQVKKNEKVTGFDWGIPKK